MGRIFSFLLVIFFVSFPISSNAASVCDYSEQVKLQNIAATIKVGYEIRTVWRDQKGNVVSESEEVKNNGLYKSTLEGYVHLMNITDDVYVTVKRGDSFNKTYFYKDTVAGYVELFTGNLVQVLDYDITIYSNSNNCPGDSLRTTRVTVPMYNSYHESPECPYIPNNEYCKEFITTPFLASDSEIKRRIGTAYNNYLNSNYREQEEKNTSFWENVSSLIHENQTMVYVGLVIFGVIVFSLVIVVIVKRNKNPLS